MTKPYAERLLKLASFFEGPVKDAPAHCALDLLPCVFPSEWQVMCGTVALRHHEPTEDRHTRLAAVQRFFELSSEESIHIFMPAAQDFLAFGGSPLHVNSTLADVSDHIRGFVHTKVW